MTHPPLHQGTNYAYWKARAKIFIQTLDEFAWDAIEASCVEPTKKKEDAITRIVKDVVKPRVEWSDAEKKAS